MNHAGILVCRELVPAAADEECLLDFGQQNHAPDRRPGSRYEQAVVAPGVKADDGGGRKSSQPVGFEPFAPEGDFQISANSLVESDHGCVIFANWEWCNYGLRTILPVFRSGAEASPE